MNIGERAYLSMLGKAIIGSFFFIIFLGVKLFSKKEDTNNLIIVNKNIFIKSIDSFTNTNEHSIEMFYKFSDSVNQKSRYLLYDFLQKNTYKIDNIKDDSIIRKGIQDSFKMSPGSSYFLLFNNKDTFFCTQDVDFTIIRILKN